MSTCQGHRVERIQVFEFCNFNEVGQGEELLDSLEPIPLVVLDVDDLKDFLGSLSVFLVVIVEVKDVGEERLGFHLLEIAILVAVVAAKYRLNVEHALLLSLTTALLKPLLVLVEDVRSQQVSQEVKT